MITFMYPFNAPTLTIDIKNPEFANVKSIMVKVGLMTMMDGSLRTERSTPANKILKLVFKDVTRRKSLELRNFIIASQSSMIRYIDFDGVSWKGFITTEPFTIMTTDRGLGSTEPRHEANTFNIDFEGTLV